MVYEISTDGGKINRNLGDDLGVEGRYYYDFGGSNWGHKFARSKDMINWEKLPYLLHDTYKGDYAFDGDQRSGSGAEHSSGSSDGCPFFEAAISYALNIAIERVSLRLS